MDETYKPFYLYFIINTQILLVLLLGLKFNLKLLHGRGTGHDQLSGGGGDVIAIHLKK